MRLSVWYTKGCSSAHLLSLCLQREWCRDLDWLHKEGDTSSVCDAPALCRAVARDLYGPVDSVVAKIEAQQCQARSEPGSPCQNNAPAFTRAGAARAQPASAFFVLAQCLCSEVTRADSTCARR